MTRPDKNLTICEFPDIKEIADPVNLKKTLEQHLKSADAGNGFNVDACTIDQVRYKPGGGLQLLFTATIRGHENGDPHRQFYFGGRLRRGNENTPFDSVELKNLAQPRFGPAVVPVPEWGMIFWAYPNDPRLPGLPVMANNERVLALARETPKNFGLTDTPVAVDAELKKYVPGMRCCYVYNMTLSPSVTDGKESSSHAIFGKTYRRDSGDKAYAIMRAIWQSEASQRGDLILPQPYSYDAENQILWQEALSGQPFAKIAGKIKNLPEVAHEIGRRLAACHGIPLELPQKMTFDSEVENLKKAITATQETFPRHAKQCDVVGQKLLRVAASLANGPTTLIHASFKFSHIISTARGIAFIDFDGANLGDPGYDLGRFIAHLCKMKAGWKINPEAANETITNFCNAYRQSAVVPVTQERIDWFAACHLVSSQVYKAVKRMKPDLVSKLLRMAEQMCPG